MAYRRSLRLLRLPLLAVLATVSLVAAGCGGSSSKDNSTPVSLAGQVNKHGTKTVKDGDSVEVEADNYYFNPTFLKAPAGAKLKLELKNDGSVPHTFTSDALHVDEQLNAGESRTIDITVPSSGSAEYHCKFHQGQGMQGGIAVT